MVFDSKVIKQYSTHALTMREFREENPRSGAMPLQGTRLNRPIFIA